jgi:hypothetical protein
MRAGSLERGVFATLENSEGSGTGGTSHSNKLLRAVPWWTEVTPLV